MGAPWGAQSLKPPTLDFSSGCDLTVCELAESTEPALGLFPFLSPSPKINKLKKKKKRILYVFLWLDISALFSTE